MGMNNDEIRKMLNQRDQNKKPGSGGGDIFWYQLPSNTDKVLLRFAPPLPHENYPGRLINSHYGIPGDHKYIYCFKTYDMDCPMCDMLREYDGKLNLDDFVSKAKTQLNVFVLSDPTYEGRYGRKLDPNAPHILGANGDFTLYWLLENTINPVVGDITDPVNGSPVEFQREKNEGKFKRVVGRVASPIAKTPEEREVMLAKLHDFKKIWKNPDDVYLQRMKDCVLKVRDVLENKLITMKTENVPLPPNQDHTMNMASAMSQTQSAPSTSQSTTTAIGVKRPTGAPSCFGDKVTHNPAKKKCLMCPMEFGCQEANKKGA
jgi:hypothetical protein